MREVAVVGGGMIPFAKYRDTSLVDLGSEAVRLAIKDSDVPVEKIDQAYCGTVYSGMLSGQKIYKEVGIDGIPIINTENACSSGATAFHLAYQAIATGVIDTAIVLGVEKLTSISGGTIPLDTDDVEVRQGLVMPGLYAMRAQRYMDEFGVSESSFAKIAVKSHENASLNPYAQYRNKVTVDEVLNSRKIAEPLTLLQCCPTGDGAAAIVLTSLNESKKYTSNPVKVLASELTSGKYTNSFRDITTPEITVRGAKIAYDLAGLGPEDIDLAEVHDAFTIAEMLYYEAFQFCEKGDAARLIEDGETKIDGSIPVNPSGGLLSKGHPLGATGAAQIVEVYNQLKNRAGHHQVKEAKVGLTHCTGGGISGFDHGACSIHIFGR